MSQLHHLDSRYASLTGKTIDFTLACVRDANEVLFESELLDARSMILVARSVMETERLFELDPHAFAELSSTPRSDWTLACAAEGFAQAMPRLHERGATGAVEKSRAELRALLNRIVDSPLRSPLVSYSAVLSELIHEHKPTSQLEKLALQRRAIAEDLLTPGQPNTASRLCDLGETYLQLGYGEIAMHVFLGLARYDPTSISLHNQLAVTLSRRFPDVARSAAERALLLMPREDTHALKPQLRRIIEELRGQSSPELPALGRSLLLELQGKPGKRSRSSLRSLCMEVAPEIAEVPTKEPEPLPDPAVLAQLRDELRTLPRPMPQHALPHEDLVTREASARLQRAEAPLMAAARSRSGEVKVGRNDLCPCGSHKKYKRCCGGRIHSAG